MKTPAEVARGCLKEALEYIDYHSACPFCECGEPDDDGGDKPHTEECPFFEYDSTESVKSLRCILGGMPESKYFHVETQAKDGTWNTFTEEPMEGEDAAKRHLEEILKVAREQGLNPQARLHELTEEDMLKHLTPEERDNIVAEYIRTLPPGEFWKKVAEARAR